MIQSAIDSDDSPETIEWMRQEVAIGAAQAEKGEFFTISLEEIKSQILSQYQQNRA
jgi:predicted transcriptional regulator